MGFLGILLPRAFEAKVATRFLRDRAIRLGIPTSCVYADYSSGHGLLAATALLCYRRPSVNAVYERYIMTSFTFLISGLLRPVLPGLRPNSLNAARKMT